MYKKIDFHGKVVSNNDKDKNTGSSYLNLPEGVELFKLEEDAKVISLDIMGYVITDPHHPCRQEGTEIATPGTIWWRRPYAIHRQIGVDNETVVCPKSIGKPCPICEHQLKLFRASGPTDETKALRAKDRDLYVIVPIGSKKHEEMPFIMDMARRNFQDTLAEDLKLKPKNELFFTPDEGKTAEVTFIWETLGDVTYPKARSFVFESRQPYNDDIPEQMPNLDNVLKVKSYDELFRLFNQMDPEDDGGELKDVKEDEPIRERKSLRERSSEKEPNTSKEEKSTERRSLRRNSGDEASKENKTEERRIRRNTDNDAEETHHSKNAENENAEKSATVGRELRSSEKAGDKGEEKCPHGHRFGVDTAEFPECDTCEIYDNCDEELIKRKKAAAK
jgi:hypothetical protein